MPTFDTPEPITAVVSFTEADIRISAAQRTDTIVEVRPADPADATDVAAAERARVTYADGRLTVKDRSSIRSLPGRITVTIELPSGSALDISVRDGLLNGQGRLGTVRAHLSQGNIRLDHTGELRLSIGHGDITVATCGGPADLTTTRGQIQVGQSTDTTVIGNGAGNVTVDRTADGLRVTAEQGAVTVGELASGRAELTVGTGTIAVGIADGTAVLLDAKTTLGRVRDNLGDNPEESGGNTVELHAHISHGDILLHRVTSGR
ncbi:DUF4097 family beta strand repeat-containing protein [Streptosporangium roseum]|uniref:DUF4097 family beta strand repeat-containing protein n=1 Tax=Streptosporangium roseum TaxID=2001 RepID=UPI0004CD0084|nr:DUF4097 family beta strand repeat-containing protein [Streptosporangium roseum]